MVKYICFQNIYFDFVNLHWIIFQENEDVEPTEDVNIFRTIDSDEYIQRTNGTTEESSNNIEEVD